LVNRQDFKMSIPRTSYEDILHLEKKALKLQSISDFINQNSFKIDMQMNLSEYLFKIMPANIFDKDLIIEQVPDDYPLRASNFRSTHHSGIGMLGLGE
jgi:hypothetical protein